MATLHTIRAWLNAPCCNSSPVSRAMLIVNLSTWVLWFALAKITPLA
jgi:hypothetical protein